MTTIPQRLREIARLVRDALQLGSPWISSAEFVKRIEAIAAELEAPAADAVPVVAEYPAGAVENGRAYAARLESAYQFECEAGPLENCSDWHDLIRCFEHLAAWPTNHLATVSALHAKLVAMAQAAGDAEARAIATVNRLHAENSALQARITELERQKEIDVEQGNVSVAHYSSVLRQLSDAQARINELESRQLPEGSIPITRQSLAELIQDGYMAGAKRGVETAVTDLLARGWKAPQSSHPDTGKDAP